MPAPLSLHPFPASRKKGCPRSDTAPTGTEKDGPAEQSPYRGGALLCGIFLRKKIWKRRKNCAMIQTKHRLRPMPRRIEGKGRWRRCDTEETRTMTRSQRRSGTVPRCWRWTGTTRRSAGKALAQLRPELPEPEAWLDALCSRLSANLFPGRGASGGGADAGADRISVRAGSTLCAVRRRS